MHWWIGLMVILYAVSGITMVRPDEVAVVLRWGRLVGETSATQEHGPGLLFAFPRPVDEVVRVPVKRVWQLPVTVLAGGEDWSGGRTLDPLRVGYALTGDHNIVHVDMMARFQIRNPAEWSFYSRHGEGIVLVEVAAAMVRSLGEMGVDSVLASGRKDLIAAATQRAQKGLDAAHAGLKLVSLELINLRPPTALAGEFDAVQSAYIEAETVKKEAEAYAQSVVPGAQSSANSAVQAARAAAASAMALARGDAASFIALDREYRINPVVVRERLYRSAVETAIGACRSVRWVPPPFNGRYRTLRIDVSPGEAGSPSPMTNTPQPVLTPPQPGGEEGQ
jgi:membrane protease subunit HflK